MAIDPSKTDPASADDATTRVTWLTLASLLTALLVLTLSPSLGVLPHYSDTVAALKLALKYPANSGLFNGLRAGLAADIVFLVAYGALLRASVQLHQSRRTADVWRFAGGVPFVSQSFDRGRALELSWQARMQDGAAPADGGPTVSDWAALAGTPRKDGRFPAFVFNTTVVETGQPLAIATTAMPSPALADELKGQLSETTVVQHFNTLFELNDSALGSRDVKLSMATAARLSSSFPYVSPAAAPAWPTEGKWSGLRRYHLVDGGYYDNFGLFALAQWLDDALTDLEKWGRSLPPSIEVIVIRGETEEKPPASVPKGWATQLTAPASAFVATRSYGQWAGGSAALKLLKDKWKGKTAICDVAFPYPAQKLRDEMPVCADTPLSWKLTGANTRCLDVAWKHSADAVETLRKIEAAVAQATRSCSVADAGR